MKQNYTFFIILLFVFTTIRSQTSDVIIGLQDPRGMALHGNDLYFSESDGDKISKIDITSTNPTPVEVVSSIFRPYGITIKDNYLYYGLNFDDKIYRIDLTAADPSSTIQEIADVSGPVALAIKDNYMYVSEDYDEEYIYRIDLNAANPVATEFVQVDTPTGMAFYGDDLYIAEYTRISKVDLTASTPVVTEVISGISPLGLLIDGSDLYYWSGSKISKIDLTIAGTPIPEEVVTGVGYAYAMAIEGNNLYIVEGGASKISKFSMTTLSVSDNHSVVKTELYPNPAKEAIRISGIEDENYIIYNLMGAQVARGSVSDHQEINVRDLVQGVYFLKLENGNTIKFVKE